MYLSPLTSFARSRVVAYAILFVVSFSCIKQCQTNKALEYKLSQNRDRVSIATKIVERYIDTNGTAHTAVQPEALTKQQAKSFIENDTYVNDTLVKALNIANNKISELTRINASLEIHSKGTVQEPGNTLSIVKGSDEWLKWAYNPVDTMMDMSYNLKLDIAGINKRKKILGLGIGDKEYFEDYSTPDKRLTINGVDRFIRPVIEPDFAFRLNVVSRYNFATGQGRVGPGVELDYKRFTMGTSYVYEPTANRWEWVIEPKFRLAKF